MAKKANVSNKLDNFFSLAEISVNNFINDHGLKDLNTSLVLNNNSEGSFSLIITRIGQVYFPRVPEQRLSSSSLNSEGLSTKTPLGHDHSYSKLSLQKENVERSEQNVITNPFRVVICGSSLRGSFQVLGVEKDFILHALIWEGGSFQVNEGLLILLNYASEKGCCRVCEGISLEEICFDGNQSINNVTLVTKTSPYLRYESPTCTYVKANQRRDSLKCQECLRWVNNRRWHLKRKIENDSMSAKKPKIDVSSKIPFSNLTPRSYQKRLTNLRNERKWLRKRNKQLESKLDKLKVPLNESQNRELTTVMEIIEKDFPNELNDVIEESDNASISNQLRRAWAEDRKKIHKDQKSQFFKDQQQNETGSCGNVWSMITYRLALAVYIRSPSAYKALKSFNILQLPSEDTLKDFTRARLQKPGIDYGYLEDQKARYKQIQMEQIQKGLLKPLGEGILIFDEVHCISKVLWNSKNNEITGLALRPEEYKSLVDIYKMAENDNPAPTDFILQFLWRDISYKFDVIGPYITSSGPVKYSTLYAIVLDVLDAFHSYGFKTRALVCDGASSNLTLIKFTLKMKGSFGFVSNQDGTRNHHVVASFKHPCWSFHKLTWIICPTHELKSMVTALFSSRPFGPKSFEFCSVQFGWNAVKQVYHEDVERSKKNDAKRVRNLYKSYIDRDSWTRLNAAPSKIMQQEEMLVALYEIAHPINGEIVPHKDEIMLSREYLEACSKIFEEGILQRVKLDKLNHPVLLSIEKGYNFFEMWLNDVLDTFPDINTSSSQQKSFLSWQTWDLLRIMAFGFREFVEDYLREHPGYFIIPGRINGSAIESLFGQFRSSTSGKLSGTNYSYAARNAIMKIDIQGQKFTDSDYRGCHIAVADSKLKRVKKLTTLR